MTLIESETQSPVGPNYKCNGDEDARDAHVCDHAC